MTGHLQATDLRDYLHHTLTASRSAHLRTHLDACQHCWNAWNRFRWDHACTTPLYQDLAEYLGENFCSYFDSSRALAREWDTASPRTDSEIRNFFRTSTSYLYNLVIWEASGHRPDYLAAALPILHRIQPRTIIDYGCGIGSDSLALRNHGFTVIPCDYHSPSTAFLRWRSARTGAALDVIEPHQLHTTADAVWIIDTLDHLRDPDRQLQPVLKDASLIISEHLTVNRAHGHQHFHHRRTPEQITQIFSHYGFVRAEELTHVQCEESITAWEKRAPCTLGVLIAPRTTIADRAAEGPAGGFRADRPAVDGGNGH